MKLVDAIIETDKLRNMQYPSGKVLKYAMRYVRQNKQLFMQAVVASGSQKGVTYQVRLVFNGILSSDKRTRLCTMKYKDLDGSIYFIQKPTSEHHILTRCGCQDFRFAHHWWLGNKKALLGPRIPYVRKTTTRPEVNPNHYTSICKHLLTFIKKLISIRMLKADQRVKSYLSRPKKSIDRFAKMTRRK